MFHVKHVGAGGHSSNYFAIDEDRLVAHRIDIAVVDRDNRELALRRLAHDSLRSVTPDEAVLVQPHEAAEPRFRRRVVDAEFAAPRAVALLQPQRIERAHATELQAM